jgi:hypothetical protein
MHSAYMNNLTQGIDALGVGTGTIPAITPTFYNGWAGPPSGTLTLLNSMPTTAPTGPSVMVHQAPTTVNGQNQSATSYELVSSLGGGNFANIGSAVTFTPGSGAGSFASGAYTITTAASSVTISAIPGAYRHLHIIVNGQTSGGSASNLTAQINGDTASHYVWSLVSNGSAVNSSGTSGVVGVLTSASLTSSPGTSILDIADYAQTNWYKSVNGTASFYGGSNMVNYQTAAQWQSTAAITSITLFPLNGGDSLTANTTITIYGEN